MSTSYSWDDGDVIDAEIVDEHPATPVNGLTDPPSTEVVVRPRPQRHRPLGAALRRGPVGGMARRRVVVGALMFVGCTFWMECASGVATWVRGWWRWKTLAEEAAGAKAEGKFAAGLKERREARGQRNVQSVLTLLALAIGVALFIWLAPPRYQLMVAVLFVSSLWVSGHRWHRPVDDEPIDARPAAWDGTITSVRNALYAAGVLKKPTKTVAGQNVWLAPGTQPEPVGHGTELVLDLSLGVTWRHILIKAEPVASGLGCNSNFMMVQMGDHDGQARLWIPDGNPYAQGTARFPLLAADSWSAWHPAPFAVTPHGHSLDLCLVGSNYLGGGKPNSGKSFSARPALAPYILDPTVRIFTFNGKGDAAWEPLRDLSVKYVRGARPEHVWELLETIDMMTEEMHRRYADSTRSKVQEDGEHPLWLLVIDEVQEYLGSTDPTDIEARNKKNARLGLVIDDRLTTLARLGRAAGIVVAMMTQRPDDSVMSMALRSMFGTRFANRTMNGGGSEIILGIKPGPGTDASKVPSTCRGLGILIPDGEKVRIEGTPLCRPYLIDDGDWETLCRRGIQLRRSAGTHGFLRRSERDAYPLPELLQAIVDEVAGLPDDQRVPSRHLRERLAPGMKETPFGRQLNLWGCPTGRDRTTLPMGPTAGGIRAAAARIREGGPVEIGKRPSR